MSPTNKTKFEARIKLNNPQHTHIGARSPSTKPKSGYLIDISTAPLWYRPSNALLPLLTFIISKPSLDVLSS